MGEHHELEVLLERDLGRPASKVEHAELDRRLAIALQGAAAKGPRRRRRLLVLALGAVLVLIPGFVVASGLVDLRPSEAPLGLVGAEEFRAEVDAAKRVVPRPEAWRWPAYLDIAYGPGVYSRGGGRIQVETAAFCLWSADWVSARGRGDAAEAARAAEALQGSRSWDIYRGPLSTASQRASVDVVLDGVVRGDEAPARSHLALNCATGS